MTTKVNSENIETDTIITVGTLTSLEIEGSLHAGSANLGNLVVANYFQGNGSLLTGVSAATVTSSAQPNITSVGTLAGLTVSGSIVPDANVTYDLGSPTYSFKDLYLSGNTLYFGGATIKTDATTGAIALVPQPTVSEPNPTGLVITTSGALSTVVTSGGNISSTDLSNAVSSSSSAGIDPLNPFLLAGM